MSFNAARLEHASLQLLMGDLYAQLLATPWWRFRRRRALQREIDKTFLRACAVFEEAFHIRQTMPRKESHGSL